MSLINTPAGEPMRPIKIDAEHFLVRFLVPVLSIVLVIVLHFVGTAVLDSLMDEGNSAACTMVPIDIVALVGIGFGLDRLLKRVIPSRRYAALGEHNLIVTDGRSKPPVVLRFEWDKAVNVKAWRFTVSKRTRVPKGWYLMAIQLLQDEQEVIFYTFMPPREAETSIGYDNFVRLRPRKETQSNSDLTAAAEQRRLLRLEDARWNDGAEITRQDFKAILAALQRWIPGWR
jgi:hypothetical protein